MLAWEQLEYDALVADIFGFNAVQIGLLELPALRGNRMPYVFSAGEWTGSSMMTRQHEPRAQLLCNLDELPFASQSLDLVVLPHALEFAEDPHRVLREVERVLMPEGQVVISGFNPISLWGARQLVGRTVGSPFLPTAGQFLALPRLKDWLKLLGFEVHRGHFGCYRPAFASERWQGRFGLMEKAGARWWPFCGAVYLVHAIKRVHGMRLIGLARKERKLQSASLQPSVNRVQRSADHGDASLRETEHEGLHVEA